MKSKWIYASLGLTSVITLVFHFKYPASQNLKHSPLTPRTHVLDSVQGQKHQTISVLSEQEKISVSKSITKNSFVFEEHQKNNSITQTAINPTYQMHLTFDQDGLCIKPNTEHNLTSKPWSFSLNHSLSGKAQAQNEGPAVSYQYTPSQKEWFINSEKGIEHGMTLTSAPSSLQQPLTFDFKVTSDLKGEAAGDNHLIFKNSEGTPTVRYEKLFAYDAKGRNIPTALTWNADASTISWRVDHQGFDYPITIDPIIATFAQTIPEPLNGVNFGRSIAIFGDFMVVGSPFNNRVYLYEKIAGSWQLFSRKNFILSPVSGDEDFGMQVSMPNLDTIMVSDSNVDVITATGSTNNDQGAIFVFGRNMGGDNNWGLVKQVTVTNPQLPDEALSDNLGIQMSCSNNIIAAVATRDNTPFGIGKKFVYIFEKDRGGLNNWGQVPDVRLEGSNLSVETSYGNSLELSQDLLVVGSSLENFQPSPEAPVENIEGAVYIYSRNQSGADKWGLVARRYAPDGFQGDRFGHSVSVSSETIAVSAIDRDLSTTRSNAGTVYILSKNEGGPNNWGVLPIRIIAADAAKDDNFGNFVRIRGEVLAVNASGDDVAGKANAGSIYLFERNLGGSNAWGAISGGKFSIDNITGIERLGSSFSLDTNYLVFPADLNLFIRPKVIVIKLTGTPTSSNSIGSVTFNSQGILTFTPNSTGTFQLRSGNNLTTWINEGAAVSGTANTPLIFNTGTPVAGQKKFFRIERN